MICRRIICCVSLVFSSEIIEHSREFTDGFLLLAANGDRFTSMMNRPTVAQDHCQHSQGLAKTLFEVRTNNMEQLPLVDFIPRDFGGPQKKFGFKIGPVCFN